MARFLVHDTFPMKDFPLEGENTFVLAGVVTEGNVIPGMTLFIPFNSTGNLTALVDRIELARRSDGEYTCLCIKCHVPDEITLWEALHIKSQSIEVR
jgi:hypothetical protein